MNLPRGFETWNRALQGAYRKGYAAGAAGECISACPYKDKRKPSGGLSWSRSFISAWQDGWNAARQDNPITAHYADRQRSGQAVSAR